MRSVYRDVGVAYEEWMACAFVFVGTILQYTAVLLSLQWLTYRLLTSCVIDSVESALIDIFSVMAQKF